jgi:hypothetical protein
MGDDDTFRPAGCTRCIENHHRLVSPGNTGRGRDRAGSKVFFHVGQGKNSAWLCAFTGRRQCISVFIGDKNELCFGVPQRNIQFLRCQAVIKGYQNTAEANSGKKKKYMLDAVFVPESPRGHLYPGQIHSAGLQQEPNWHGGSRYMSTPDCLTPGAQTNAGAGNPPTFRARKIH